jgi:hypothetical protein
MMHSGDPLLEPELVVTNNIIIFDKNVIADSVLCNSM